MEILAKEKIIVKLKEQIRKSKSHEDGKETLKLEKLLEKIIASKEVYF